MRVQFSQIASYKIERLLEYLEMEWSAASRRKFVAALQDRIEALKQNPLGFPVSHFRPDIRKLVITKQTTALYTIRDEVIYIITVFDNRQDPSKTYEEIIKHFD
ncbi:MAG: type II toxin-antitoxin system RelE/ParE family toxin [Bacteroidota bacterium]